MDKPDLRWNKEDQVAFTKAVEKCLKHYQWLGKHCFEKGLLRYSLVQKFHLTAHMPSTAQWMNPRMKLGSHFSFDNMCHVQDLQSCTP